MAHTPLNPWCNKRAIPLFASRMIKKECVGNTHDK